jgi:hypothetical protein
LVSPLVVRRPDWYGIAYLGLVEAFDDLRGCMLVRVLSGFPPPSFPSAWSIHRGDISRHARVS